MAHIPDLVFLLVRFVHIAAGIVWVGGLVYAGFAVGRSLMDAPPQVRGPAMQRIGPVGFSLLNWAGIVTILFGVANEAIIDLGSHAPEGTFDRWHMWLGFGLIASLAMLGIGHGLVKPTLRKMAAAASGPAPPDPAQMAALQKRMMIASLSGITLGMLTIFVMVYATRLRAGP